MNLEKYFICYDTKEEAINIANKLVDLGYKVYDLNGVGDPDWHKWKGFLYTSKYFVQSRAIDMKLPISYEDFIKIINRKKIKNIEIDPFEEENWGFEK